MPPEDAELARFQAALLDLLSEGLTTDATIHRLRTDAAFMPFTEYVASFEPRMVEVAAQLVARWGVRASPDASADGRG